MIINTPKPKLLTTPFVDIAVGDVFSWNGHFYLKIEKNTVGNAVVIKSSNGYNEYTTVLFDPGHLVTKYNAVLNLEML
jgi:hypothetical protein